MDIFDGTKGPRDADIMIVGESYGREERAENKPFVGQSGKEQDILLSECGLSSNTIFFSNVINEQPFGNHMELFFHTTAEAKANKSTPIRGLYPQNKVNIGVEKLYEQIALVKPKAIVALGNYALWALTDNSFNIGDKEGRKVPSGIGLYRGSQLRDRRYDIPVMPTYHPAAWMRSWPWRYQAKHDLSSRLPKALSNSWDQPEYNFTVRPSFTTVKEVLTKLVTDANKAEEDIWVSCDTETREGHIACIGFGWSATDAICIPLMRAGQKEGYWSLEEEIAIIKLVRTVMTHPKIRIIGQNFLYDIQYIALSWGFIPEVSFDTMVIQHLCFPGTDLSLNYISSLYCNFHAYWKDEGKEWQYWMPEERHWSYNCKDCVTTWEAAMVLRTLITHFGFEHLARIQMRQVKLIAKMMIRGVLVDQSARWQCQRELAETAKLFEQKLDSLMRGIYESPPKAAKWYRSPKQQQYIFYEMLGCDIVKHHKTKRPTLDDEALEIIGNKEPILRALTIPLAEYRSLETFKNFTESRLDFDGRMRCQYTPTADTFRWKSSESAFGTGGNLQNIPKGTEED